MEGEPVPQGETGIYTLINPDNETVSNIERSKQFYIANVNYMGRREAVEQLDGILSDMYVFMCKYGYKDYLKDYKVDDKYTFEYVRKIINYTNGNATLLRRASEIAFEVWENVIRVLGYSVPTTFFRP